MRIRTVHYPYAIILIAAAVLIISLIGAAR